MRRQSPQTQLEWENRKTRCWETLPAGIREQVREPLGVLVRHVAGPAAPPQEPPDEE
ncbi:MAG: hypothetical protein ACE5JR_13680 [Gemmatimonadota bacterium]